MSKSPALAFLAGAAGGALSQYQRAEDKARLDKQDARADAADARTQADFNQKQSDRQALIDAGRPMAADVGAGGFTKPETMDNRDVGQPGEQAPMAGAIFKGQSFPTADAASAAATAYNAPAARTGRIVDALQSTGRPAEAAQIDAAATQSKVAKLQLDEAEEKHLNDLYDKKLADMAAQGPDSVAKFLTESKGFNGTVAAAAGNDGKVLFTATGPEGTQRLVGSPFDPKDTKQVLVDFSKGMGLPQKITFMQHAEDQARLQKNTDRTFDEGVRQFGVNKVLQEKSIGIQGAHLGIAREQAQLARDKYESDLKQDPSRNLPGGVKLEIGGIDSSLKAIEAQISQAQAQGSWDPNGQGQRALLARQADLSERRSKLLAPFTGAAVTGMPAAAAGAVGAKPDPMGYSKGAPAAPAAAGGVMPRNVAPGAGFSAPVAQPAAAVPAAAAKPTLQQALGASGNGSIDAIISQRIPALEQGVQVINQAKQQLVAAAKSGDQRAIQEYAASVQQARNAFDAQLKDMQPQQAEAVRKAAGYYD